MGDLAIWLTENDGKYCLVCFAIIKKIGLDVLTPFSPYICYVKNGETYLNFTSPGKPKVSS